MALDAKIRRKRIDLLVEKDDKITAIEVKLRDRRGIADDIVKLANLRFLPDIDLFFIAAPKVNLQEDILGFAKRMDIGVFGVTEQGVEQLVKSREAVPASVMGSSSIPSAVVSGEVFEIAISIQNTGEKSARNIKLMYMSAYPFRVPRGERNHKSIKELMPGKEEKVIFKIRVEDKAKPGEYGLYVRRTAERGRSKDDLYNIKVQKKIIPYKERRQTQS